MPDPPPLMNATMSSMSSLDFAVLDENFDLRAGRNCPPPSDTQSCRVDSIPPTDGAWVGVPTLVVTAERQYAPTVMTPSPVPGAAVTQFAVIDALLAGAYESGLRVADARSIGDYGLGCVNHPGGEVVIVDGEAIECTLDGPPVAMDDDDILPFAIVCRFPDVARVRLGEQDFTGFAATVEGALRSRNLFHAVRFDGVLSEVRVRVTPRQHHPFPRLAEVTSHQVETVARDVRGTVVGFWTPAIYQGIAVAGPHHHF